VRSFLALAIAALAAMLLQTAVLAWWTWLPVVPDLVFVLAVYLAVRHHSVAGACGAFLLGCFLDTFAGTAMGVNACAFSAAYAAVYLIARHLWMEGGAPIMAVVFIGAAVREVAMLALSGAVGANVLWQHAVGRGILAAGAAALVAPVVFACVNREKQLLGLR
jgi:rod shape-determining protein MreD